MFSTRLFLKRVSVFFLLAFFPYLQPAAQTVPGPKIQSPNAAGIERFGEIPVSFFTGAPNISFPLYTVSVGSIKVPISLDYHPASVKPNVHPGWVGLGWNLQSYGTITRRPRGFLDEVKGGSASFQAYYPSGTATAGATALNVSNWDSKTTIENYFQAGGGNTKDAQADEFSFSFMGYSGKFFYTYNGWQVASDQNIRVSENGTLSDLEMSYTLDQYMGNTNRSLGVQTPNNQSRMFKGFTLITDDGTKYIFGVDGDIHQYDQTTRGEYDAVEYQSSYTDQTDGFLLTTWNLKRIIDKDGNSVTFSYKRKAPICQLSFYAQYFASACQYNPDHTFWDQTFTSYGGSSQISTRYHGGFMIWPVYLSGISTSGNDKIDFTSGFSAEKTYTTNYLKYTDDYSVGVANEITRWRLSTLDDLQWEQLNEVAIKNGSGDVLRKYRFSYSNSTSERLTLNSLTEQDKAGNDVKTYVFEYKDKYDATGHNTVADLPDYGGNYTDHWGFYNGKDINNVFWSNIMTAKSPDPLYMAKGLLTRITYPTGGHTDFVWEPHNYSNVVSVARDAVSQLSGIASGCRIKEIHHYTDGTLSSEAWFKKYYYINGFSHVANLSSLPSSGILNGLPQYYFMMHKTSSDGLTTIDFQDASLNSFVSYSYNGAASHIGYSDVVEENKDGSYTKYTFTNYNADIFGNSHYDIAPGVSGWTVGEDRYITMSSLELERGKLTSVSAFKNDDILVEKTLNYYRTDPGRFSDYIKVVDLRYSMLCNIGSAVILASAYKEFKYNYYVVKKEVTRYSTDGQQAITTTSNFSYNASDLLSEQSDVQSDGSTMKTVFKYPVDFASTGTPNVYNTMTNRFIISPIIEKSTYKNGNFLEATKTDYTVWYGSLILPSTVGHKVSGQSAYETIISYRSFDEHANITCLIKSNHYFSYIWDYNSCYPVSEVVDGWDYIDAYTSFEADGTGNFSGINSANIVNAPGVTGNRYYKQDNFSITRQVVYPSTISYWSKNGSYKVNTYSGTPGRTYNGWTYYEHRDISPSHGLITIAGSGAIDELRLYPATSAQMTTYTYDPLKGVSSKCDAKGVITYYAYDGFGRLSVVSDQDGNVIKKYCYNYQGQTENCNLFQNTSQTLYFTKQCTACGTRGTSVAYTVPANKYFSAVSQQDADNKAIAEANALGQDNANNAGSCVNQFVTLQPSNTSGTTVTASFYNTCSGVTSTFTLNNNVFTPLGPIPIGIYNITMSNNAFANKTYMIGSNSNYTQYGSTVTFNNVNLQASMAGITIY